VSGTTSRLRGVSAVSPQVAWASGGNGTLLRTVDGGATWTKLAPPAGAEKLDFRDIDAFSDRVAYALSIGSGDTSRIYKTSDGGATWALQFANTDPKVFLDAMAFRDADRGFAFSDSVDGRFVILATSNGGSAWERIPADRLPAALPDEGAFAASGTNVAVVGSSVWIGTTKSRVLRSTDEGRSWTVVQTPLDTGEATGIFSVAFKDATHGVIVGGDYQQENAAGDNAAFTSDGGATWTLAKGITGFRSVAAWVPGTRSVLAIGPSGADWSADEGRSWTAVALTGAPAGFDAFGFAPGTGIGWASGAAGRISRLAVTP
ncbi:MAG: WD40/YVTN/BNR-like repeat-containing protein, partial [Vicinamibacterales bacterium]